jgi:hypothetical protein
VVGGGPVLDHAAVSASPHLEEVPQARRRHHDDRLVAHDVDLGRREVLVDPVVLGCDVGMVAEPGPAGGREAVDAGAPQRSHHRGHLRPDPEVAAHDARGVGVS